MFWKGIQKTKQEGSKQSKWNLESKDDMIWSQSEVRESYKECLCEDFSDILKGGYIERLSM